MRTKRAVLQIISESLNTFSECQRGLLTRCGKVSVPHCLSRTHHSPIVPQSMTLRLILIKYCTEIKYVPIPIDIN